MCGFRATRICSCSILIECRPCRRADIPYRRYLVHFLELSNRFARKRSKHAGDWPVVYPELFQFPLQRSHFRSGGADHQELCEIKLGTNARRLRTGRLDQRRRGSNGCWHIPHCHGQRAAAVCRGTNNHFGNAVCLRRKQDHVPDDSRLHRVWIRIERDIVASSRTSGHGHARALSDCKAST